MNSNNLRKNFIAMLFALVIATIAQRSTDILFQLTNSWSVLPFKTTAISNLFADNWKLLSAVSHATLGLLLVSVSWVGWSKSESAGNKEAIARLASWAFILLLIEVVLVTLYFAIASSIELAVKDYQVIKNPPKPSSKPEALLVGLVFLVYFIWDIIADVIKSPLNMNNTNGLSESSNKSPVLGFLTGSITYGFVSFVCMLLALKIYDLSPLAGDPRIAVFGDLALIALVFLFRSMKPLEKYLINIFPWEGTRSNSVHSLPNTSKSALFIGLPSVLYLICLITMICLNTNNYP
ncbi:MAG: hypothetical protein HWE26_14550 [Alteromonadaceae bacterium]|nr:hypothetical protein [Alteromonadaceae bacterium]